MTQACRRLVFLILVVCAVATYAADGSPRVLAIVAHPDDESCFAATTYRITKELGGTVDEVIITDGAGGYRYSALANAYYGAELTNEFVGRAKLPEIRKQEALNAGRILGIRNHFFLDQPDPGYTQDLGQGFSSWNAEVVRMQVADILNRGMYDFVFTLLPRPDTHGQHKAATMVALQSVAAMKGAHPVVLGCEDSTAANPTPAAYGANAELPDASVLPQSPRYRFDRAIKFGFNNALDYQIVVNWMIAEHKSQGLFQTNFNHDRFENFTVYEMNGAGAVRAANRLFEMLTSGGYGQAR